MKDKSISPKELYRIALLFDLEPLSVSQLNWQIEELHALDAIQADVPEHVRGQLLAGSTYSDNVIRQLNRD